VKVARDTWIIFQRQVLLMTRTPIGLVFSFTLSLSFLLLYVPVLKLALKSQGVTTYTGAYQVYVPGLLMVIAISSGLWGGFGLLAEIRSGVIERGWVTPVSRVAMILGRTLRDVADVVVRALIITLFALPLGLRVTVPGVLLGLVLLALLSLGATGLGYSVIMWARDEGTFRSVLTTFTMPLTLTAGSLLPLTLAPLWLLWVARFNPFYWLTSGLRSLYAGDIGARAVWIGLMIGTALAALTVTWSVRMFARVVQ
jgi:ABC-2 type transport system permease protein